MGKFGKKEFKRKLRQRRSIAGVLASVFFLSVPVFAQGILTITPGRTTTTTAGSGIAGYSGDGGAATSATVASPSAVAYDAAGNMYLADANNHVIRKVTAGGVISTIAGTGVAGFGGDGGAATSAYLDTPTGIAVDGSGNVYIADSHNNRIRKITGTTISTIAGTGVAGFGGDNGAATSALLARPSAVAVNTNGDVYIADTNNHRIRKIAGGSIITVAGDGEELFAGDGGAATSAALDAPTGVAIDSTGKIYIADRNNQRIRVVDTSGNISTLAGSGPASFAGGFSGDGSSATAATLAKPTGVSVDAAGNVYIADTNNQRIRQVSGGSIATIIGTGAQGFSGDGGTSTSAILNAPKSVGVDVSGNLAVADTLNQRIRSGALPAIAFGNQIVGIPSAGTPITLTNSGTGSLTVATIGFTGPFTTATGGTCSAAPITLAAGASCTQNVEYLPTTVGAASGTVSFSGTGVTSQSVLLSGTATQASTTTTLTANAIVTLLGQSITFTATVAPAGLGTPTGTVTFYDGAVAIGSPQTLTNGSASIATAALAVGTHSIKAVYSGDTNFIASTSSPIAVQVGDFNFTLIPDPSNPGGSTSQTVIPGQDATFSFSIAPVNGPFNFPITLSATGLPPGATVTFVPSTITLGATPSSFKMTVHTSATARLMHGTKLFGGGGIALGVLLLPFAIRRRRNGQHLKPMLFGAVVCVLGAAALIGITGCGASSGFFGQPQKTYTITVTGTATAPGGATLQHSGTVTLTVQ